MIFCCSYYSLNPLPVCRGAAAVPHRDTACPQALDIRAVEDQQQMIPPPILQFKQVELELRFHTRSSFSCFLLLSSVSSQVNIQRERGNENLEQRVLRA